MVRIATSLREFALHRIGDRIYYDHVLCAGTEVAAGVKVGPRRKQRIHPFNPALAELAYQDLG